MTEGSENGRDFTWAQLGRGEETAAAAAKEEALELARALAAQTIAVDREAVIEEFADRLRTLSKTIWPTEPLAGYELHSSLGAFVVAKVAVGLVPTGHTGHRHEPLRRQGLLNGLLEHGVDAAMAETVIGDWEGVKPGFAGDPGGLDTSIIAGLAERTLTRDERDRALSQAAYSPRCLLRLASTCSLLAASRAILPELPSQKLGSPFVAALAAIAIGRPDRVLELFDDSCDTLALRTVHELSVALCALGRGQEPFIEDDGVIRMPPVETSEEAARAVQDAAADTSDLSDSPSEDDDEDDDDDVLEIVEEKVQSDHEEGEIEAVVARPPQPVRWEAGTELDAQVLEKWRDERRSLAGIAARKGAVLGLRLPAPALTVLPVPVPPDERVLQEVMARAEAEGDATEVMPFDAMQSGKHVRIEGTTFDPLFPAVRGALRAVIAAADGRAPTRDAVNKAGDLAWLLARARALALLVRGDLASACEAVKSLPDDASPEGRWAQDRMLRFGERTPERVSPEEARPVAAGLVADLAQQLARTIAGTVPNDMPGVGYR